MAIFSEHNDLLGKPQVPWNSRDWLILIISVIAFLLLYIPFLIKPEFKQGVDEGVLVMQGKMVAEGYSLYDEVYSNQAPLGILIFALLQGDFWATNRLSPPWLTDVAENRPDKLNSSYLIEVVEEYKIRLVVLSYWLIEQEDFREFVAKEFNFDSSYSEYDGSKEWIYEIWIKASL
ncbi:MAG: hypothetical protein ACFFB3_17575 [Candidatus Hodarchaeota archaeon]